MRALWIGLFVSVLVGCRVDGYYVFPERHTLTVQISGRGAGIVSSDPEGLTCSAGACSGEFFEGTEVRLSASATTGSFLGWAEACRGLDTCTVPMDRDRVMGALFGAPGDSLWVKQLGGEESDYGRSVALDRDGNLVAIGVFAGTAAADWELTSNGDNDIYVVKLAGLTGNLIWAKRLGGLLSDSAFQVAVDHANDIYITGTFEGTVDFGGGALTSLGSSATFVLKLNADGSLGWARKIDGQRFYEPGPIATDGNTVVIASDYAQSVTVDTTTFTDGTTFVVKMSASTGATAWAKSFKAVVRSVSLDSSTDVVLTGAFSGIVDFGGRTLSATGGAGFLVKLADADGAALLAKQFQGSSGPGADGSVVAVDPADNIIVTGSFGGTLDLGCIGPLTATNATSPDIFLMKYSPAGSCIWARSFGGTGAFPHAHALDVNDSGEIAVAGEFQGSISFGGKTLSAGGATDVFAARFAGDGAHLTSVRAGGDSLDGGLGVVQSPDGRFFVTGIFLDYSDFGGEALDPIGGFDAFIAAFPPL